MAVQPDINSKPKHCRSQATRAAQSSSQQSQWAASRNCHAQSGHSSIRVSSSSSSGRERRRLSKAKMTLTIRNLKFENELLRDTISAMQALYLEDQAQAFGVKNTQRIHQPSALFDLFGDRDAQLEIAGKADVGTQTSISGINGADSAAGIAARTQVGNLIFKPTSQYLDMRVPMKVIQDAEEVFAHSDNPASPVGDSSAEGAMHKAKDIENVIMFPPGHPKAAVPPGSQGQFFTNSIKQNEGTSYSVGAPQLGYGVCQPLHPEAASKHYEHIICGIGTSSVASDPLESETVASEATGCIIVEDFNSQETAPQLQCEPSKPTDVGGVFCTSQVREADDGIPASGILVFDGKYTGEAEKYALYEVYKEQILRAPLHTRIQNLESLQKWLNQE